MITPQLAVSQWVSLPQEVRQILKGMFSIPRSGGAEVVDDRVISDGHTIKDLSVITVEAMQRIVGTESSEYFTLFNKVLDFIDAEMKENKVAAELAREEKALARQDEVQAEAVKALAGVTELVESVKRRGRPKKVTE